MWIPRLLSEDGLRRLISAAEEEEPIQESEKQMIASILEMDETVAREVMVPRIDLVALNVETSLQEALAVIIGVGHSRIPVYEENIDQIVGFLYAKDVLKAFAIQSDGCRHPLTIAPALPCAGQQKSEYVAA